MTNKIELPSVPSELLELAQADLLAIEQTPGYEINMEDWHRPEGNKCSVCMAGAVMARTLKVPRNKEVFAMDFDDKTSGALEAINGFRDGDCGDAFARMGMEWRLGKQFSRRMPTYAKDPEGFHAATTTLIKDLRSAGY